MHSEKSPRKHSFSDEILFKSGVTHYMVSYSTISYLIFKNTSIGAVNLIKQASMESYRYNFQLMYVDHSEKQIKVKIRIII